MEGNETKVPPGPASDKASRTLQLPDPDPVTTDLMALVLQPADLSKASGTMGETNENNDKIDALMILAPADEDGRK